MDTKAQLLENPSLCLYNLVLQINILLIQYQRHRFLFLSQMPKAMEYIDDISDSSWSLFYFGSQVNTSHGHMLKCT